MFCLGLRGCPAWVWPVEGRQQSGPGGAAGSQQAVLLLPTALGSQAGKGQSRAPRPGRAAASRPGAQPVPARGSPEPVPAVPAAGKSTFPEQSSHICPSACQPAPSIPFPAITTAPDSRRAGAAPPVPDEGCWPLAVLRAGALLCHRGGVCWLGTPSVPVALILSPQPPTAALGLLSPLVQAATQGGWQRNRAVRTLPSLQGHPYSPQPSEPISTAQRG